MINTSTPFNITMNYVTGKWTCTWSNLSHYDVSNYKIIIWAIDDNGNVNQTELVIITIIDVINPNVVIELPADGSTHNNVVNIVINATITDDSSVINAKAMINASTPFNISMIYIAVLGRANGIIRVNILLIIIKSRFGQLTMQVM